MTRRNAARGNPRLNPAIADGERATVAGLLDHAKQRPEGPQTLRDLATWYRRFAERADNPTIWEARLRMAEDLDAEADRILRRLRADDPPASRDRSTG
jgi:hypothetical protein